MSPLVETSVIFQRELRKNFRSAKGIVLGLLTVLGGTGLALAVAKFNTMAGEAGGAVPLALYAKVYGEETAQWLADAPGILLMLLGVTVALAPLLIALMGFDAIAPDIQHRTVRYWTLRSRRVSYFVAKWLGLWATVSVLTFTMDLIIWIVCIAQNQAPAGKTLSWGLRFWLISVPLGAIWSAIAVFISALFRQPILALLVTFATFFALWVVYLVVGYFEVAPLLYVYPNHYDRLLMDPHLSRYVGGVLASLAMAGAWVGAGTALFARRDV
jgi:ABC-type transport system involved in multi-copper enzyme maturation permease subunit